MNGFAQSTIQFKDSKKNFGMVKKGELVKVVYEFKNSGNSPLIIYDYKVGCACTEVEFSRDPVLPGESAEILVKFDSKDSAELFVRQHAGKHEHFPYRFNNFFEFKRTK